MAKIRVVFDNNIINILADCSQDLIVQIAAKCELLNCDELKNQLEKVRHIKNNLYIKAKSILKHFEINNCFAFALVDWNNTNKADEKFINTYGFVDWNAKDKNKVKLIEYKDVEIYSKIHKNGINPKHEEDRQIALIASMYDADILITEDKKFYKCIKKTNLKVLNFEEFLKFLNLEK